MSAPEVPKRSTCQTHDDHLRKARDYFRTGDKVGTITELRLAKEAAQACARREEDDEKISPTVCDSAGLPGCLGNQGLRSLTL